MRQADGQARPTQGSVEVLLTLGALEEPTVFTVFDLDCDADVILGFSWLRSHGLTFVYEDSQVCLCAEAGCTSPSRAGGYAWTWPRHRRRPPTLPRSFKLGDPPCCG